MVAVPNGQDAGAQIGSHANALGQRKEREPLAVGSLKVGRDRLPA
jgi:hypothetical protein